MTLLYVHQAFGSLGGAEANVFATASALKARGHSVGLLTQTPTGKGEAAWRGLFGEAIFQIGGDRAGFQADVVYVHKWEHLPTIKRLLDAHTPLVRMVHDHDIYCLRSYRYNPLTRTVCTRPAGGHCVFPCLAPLKRNRAGGAPFRWTSFSEKLREIALSRRFDRNVVATEFMKGELRINGFDPARIEVIPPVPPPAPPLRSTFSDRNLLVYAGQIVRGKGVDVLLRALTKVKQPFEALILGDGSHRPACEKLAAKLGLLDRVTFKGFIPRAELNAYYRDASAVLVPSVWPEPMALVGLEAMRNALPVVGFNAGGIGEWLTDGENGFLVPWMDTERFAESIDALLTDKTRARAMGQRGFECVTRDFDFERYIDSLEDLFHRVAEERLAPA